MSRDYSLTIRAGTEQGRVPTARLDPEVNEELPKKEKIHKFQDY